LGGAAVRKLALAFACFLAISSSFGFAQTSEQTRSDDGQKYLQWLSKSLASAQTIKVGMTRRDLLTLFKEDGGVQSIKSERYVYKQCPIIKVDVSFSIDTADHLDDRIERISKPYLENPYSD
jgi:hypothetical protein